MTVQEAIDRIDTIKPNTIQEEEKVMWLSELDGQVFSEIIKNHEGEEAERGFDGYRYGADMFKELLLPFPYDDLYTHHLALKIDLATRDTESYEREKTLFNTRYNEFSQHWTYTHMPRQRVTHFEL